MPNLNMNGNLTALSGLRYLRTLNLQGNRLSGQLDPLQNQTGLVSVNLANNQLNGKLDVLPTLRLLKDANLSSNQFEESAPADGIGKDKPSTVDLKSLPLTSFDITNNTRLSNTNFLLPSSIQKCALPCGATGNLAEICSIQCPERRTDPTVAPNQTESASSSLNSGAIAGIVIGVVVVLAAIGFLVTRRSKKQQRRPRAKPLPPIPNTRQESLLVQEVDLEDLIFRTEPFNESLELEDRKILALRMAGVHPQEMYYPVGIKFLRRDYRQDWFGGHPPVFEFYKDSVKFQAPQQASLQTNIPLRPNALESTLNNETDCEIDPETVYTCSYRVKIVQLQPNKHIAVGFASALYPPFLLPGLTNRSIAMWSNGQKHLNDAMGHSYGPEFGVGDVIEAGFTLKMHNGHKVADFFFRVNDKSLGFAYSNVRNFDPLHIYPTIGGEGSCVVSVEFQ
ncbi:hypothetical protein EDD86DRAFT_215038 [Gorgonomyces haynaldii]|nr:hypothetical protein EDD86DRAFT_215038 [Gorgonomyces haynaldii]